MCNFKAIAQLYQKYRLCGILPVFEKIPVNLIRDSKRTHQAAPICVISKRYLNSIKNTDFSVFYRYFEKIPINPTSDSKRTLQAALVCIISKR